MKGGISTVKVYHFSFLVFVECFKEIVYIIPVLKIYIVESSVGQESRKIVCRPTGLRKVSWRGSVE